MTYVPKKGIPHPTDIHIGARIRIRRNQLDMSQEQLADHIGLTFQQVQKYEKGTNRVSGSRMQQIAEKLAVPISYFYEGAPGNGAQLDDATSKTIADFASSVDAMAIMKAWPTFDHQQRRALAMCALAMQKAQL